MFSASFFICVFAIISMIPIGFWGNFEKGTLAFVFFFSLISGSLLLAAGLYDSDRDKSAAAKPPRFYTVNEDGDIVLEEMDAILAENQIGYKEVRRADGKVDISMEIHSKEQAVEVLAALAVMYDRGDIADADYHCNVHKIREHFNL